MKADLGGMVRAHGGKTSTSNSVIETLSPCWAKQVMVASSWSTVGQSQLIMVWETDTGDCDAGVFELFHEFAKG